MHPDKTQPAEFPQLELTEKERAQIDLRARHGLLRALAAQAVMALIMVVLAWILAGTQAALSALLGAAVYYLPNTMFALRLLFSYSGMRRAGAVAFFWGQAAKLALSGALVVLVAWQLSAWLVWPAFLLGLLGVMKGYVVLLAMRRLP